MVSAWIFVSFKYIYFFAEYGPQGLIDVRYDVVELPITLPFQKPPADKPNPKQGIGNNKLSVLTIWLVNEVAIK